MAYTKRQLGVERFTPAGNGNVMQNFYGWVQGDACDATTENVLGDIASGAAGVFPSGNTLFVEGASYLIWAADATSAATLAGSTNPPNMHVQAGPATITDAPAATCPNWPFSKEKLPIKLGPGQVKIAIRNAGSVTARVYAVRVG